MSEKKAIFLCGFMGCGKSTVGRILARKLDCDFIDMDEYIVEKQGMSILQIFEEKGEDFFREAETEAVRELSARNGVIACGGGAMLKKINADIANEAGYVVYIDVEFEVCYRRIAGNPNRPLVVNNTKEDLAFIYESRVPVYRENSAFIVSGNASPEETADRINELFERFIYT